MLLMHSVNLPAQTVQLGRWARLHQSVFAACRRMLVALNFCVQLLGRRRAAEWGEGRERVTLARGVEADEEDSPDGVEAPDLDVDKCAKISKHQCRRRPATPTC